MPQRVLFETSSSLEHLSFHLAGIFKNTPAYWCCCYIDKIDTKSVSLSDGEQACYDQLKTVRQREFLAGRYCARQSVSQIGRDLGALLWDNDGVPIWPTDLVGSISHKSQLCAAVISQSKLIESIGIDIEKNEPLKHELWNLYCTKRELAWVMSHSNPNQFVNLIFSIKESAYKCYFPLARLRLEFDDMEVSLAPEMNGKFTVVIARGCHNGPDGKLLSGRYSMDSEIIVTGAVIYRSQVD